MSLLSQVIQFAVVMACLAGGVAAYVYLGTKSELAATMPMPRALKTVSEAHDELLLYGRALGELGSEASSRLKSAAAGNRPVASRLLGRLERLHRTGRELEPRLTREEGRALIAFQKGESLLQAAIERSTELGAGFDPADIADARAQLSHAFELARGKSLEELITKSRRTAGTGRTRAVLDDVQRAGERLRLGAGEE